MQEICNRIKEIRAAKGLSRARIGHLLGERESKIQDIERGKQRPKDEILSALVNRLGINAHWLLTGSGPMVSDAPSPAPEGEFVLVPRLDIAPSAGPGAASEGEPLATGLYSFRRTWLTRQGWDPAHLHLVEASGDSMEPTIPDGSAVLVDTREATRTHLTSAIYVLRIPDATGSVVIKRLQEAPANRLLISSDNLAYKDIPIPAEERDQVRIIGRAVWAGRRL